MPVICGFEATTLNTATLEESLPGAVLVFDADKAHIVDLDPGKPLGACLDLAALPASLHAGCDHGIDGDTACFEVYLERVDVKNVVLEEVIDHSGTGQREGRSIELERAFDLSKRLRSNFDGEFD